MQPAVEPAGFFSVATAAGLPPYCEPTNTFLYHFSRISGACVPTPLAFVSNSLGALSIVAWLFAQLPQLYRNWRVSSTSGLSVFFLLEWWLGDFSNLLGALFTHQASWQVCIGAYYVFVDLCLVSQWLWYEKLRHGNLVRRIRRRRASDSSSTDGWDRSSSDGATGAGDTLDSNGLYRYDKKIQIVPSTTTATSPETVFRTPSYAVPGQRDQTSSSPKLIATTGRTTVGGSTASSSFPSPSPRTMLFFACLVSLARASPISQQSSPQGMPTATEQIGKVLSWASTALYLGSRLPQLYKNWQRKSTAGLSPLLFAAAFTGNFLYSAALATNPNAWNDFAAHGGRGWAGPQGNSREAWVATALPFFLGASGVLALDASVGLQFVLYGGADGDEDTLVVVVVEDDANTGPDSVVIRESKGPRRPRWRRVSGWMRGWMPGSGEAMRPRAATSRTAENQPLLPTRSVVADPAEREAGLAPASGGELRYGST